ncbi:uncharacterized protein [Typha angustifolia]|uniref:uncharacterized protein n=1 Tax=Typha angustifolia TaxID=59011 RepID=UPI003C2CE280
MRGKFPGGLMSLTRKWWKRRRGGGREGEDDDRIHEDSQPMDTQEQEEMIRSFERKHAQQSRTWRGVFAGFLLGYVGVLIYSIYQQVWFPWELQYHAYFMDEMLPWMVIIADWIGVLACLLAVKGLLHKSSSSKKWMRYSIYTSLLVTVFWLYYMLSLPKFHWNIIWLPFAPLSGAAMCFYVDHLLLESLEDIGKLRGYMYNYKAL